MQDKPTTTVLGDGRLHLRHGVLDILVGVDASPGAIEAAQRAVALRFLDVVDEIAMESGLLGQPSIKASTQLTSPVSRRMWRAVRPFADEFPASPLLAARGAIAEELLSTAVSAAVLDRVFVSIAGTVAFHLTPGFAFRAGLADRADGGSIFATADIRTTDPVRGIGIAGRGDMSGNPGLAEAVTVVAQTAAKAEAAAAVIAAATDLGDLVAVRGRAPAAEWAAFGDRLQIVETPTLSAERVAEALDAGVARANVLLQAGHLVGAAIRLSGETRLVGRVAPTPLDESSMPERVGRRA